MIEVLRLDLRFVEEPLPASSMSDQHTPRSSTVGRMSGRRERSRSIAIALAVIAAGCLIAGSLGKRWLTTESGESGLGLMDYELCRGEARCETGSVSKLVDEINADIERTKQLNKTLPPREQVPLPRKPWGGFPVVGVIAFVAALVAAAGLLIAAGLALARKRAEWPILPTTGAVLGLVVGLVNGCLFVATKPDEGANLGVGWTFILFGGGIVLGLAGVFPLNRQIRPIDEELGEASATMSWGSSRDDEP